MCVVREQALLLVQNVLLKIDVTILERHRLAHKQKGIIQRMNYISKGIHLGDVLLLRGD